MPVSLEQRQISNLIFFLQDRWQPNVENVSSKGGDLRIGPSFDRVALLESYLWLRLGVEVECFHSGYVQQVLTDYLAIVEGAYSATVKAGHDRLFQDNLKATLQGIPLSQNLPLPKEWHLDRSNKLLTFRNFMLLSNRFDRDPHAREIIQVINFANPTEWAATMDSVRPFSKRAVLESREAWNKNQPARDRFSSSLTNIVEYMETYSDLDEKTDLPHHELEIFSAFQQWRLNFKDETARSRFEELAERLILCLAEDETVQADLAEESRKVEELVDELRRKIRVLMVRWGAPPLAVQVGAW